MNKTYFMQLHNYNSARETFDGFYIVFASSTEDAVSLIKKDKRYKELGSGTLIEQLTLEEFLDSLGALHSDDNRVYELWYESDN